MDRDTMILDNMGIVRAIANSYRYDNEELMSIGTIGLIKAVDNFDPELGFKFSTYAYSYVQGYIKTYFKSVESNISLFEEVHSYDDNSTLLIDTISGDHDVEYDIIQDDLFKNRKQLINDILDILPELDKNVFRLYMKCIDPKSIQKKYKLSSSKYYQIITKVERFVKHKIIYTNNRDDYYL